MPSFSGLVSGFFSRTFEGVERAYTCLALGIDKGFEAHTHCKMTASHIARAVCHIARAACHIASAVCDIVLHVLHVS